MKHLTQSDFKEFIAGKDIVVDYYASWCWPCRTLSPLLEKLANEEGAAVVKVDIDAEPELTRAAGIMSIPTVVRYKDSEEVARLVGVWPYPELVAKLVE